MTVAQVADEVHLSSSTMVGIIDRLESKNLLERKRSVTDRREVYVSITDEGKTIAQKAPIPLQDKLDTGLAQLSDSQQKAIIKSLEQLVSILDPTGTQTFSEAEWRE